MQRRDFIQTCSSATAGMLLTGISGLALRNNDLQSGELFVLVFL
ncbi:MAG: twin-arginine translocation signal domain-containing protein, partial [Sediminibacterium sp.]